MTKAGVRLEVLLNATTRRDEQSNNIGVVGIGECYCLVTLIYDSCTSFWPCFPCDWTGQDITARLAQEREYSKLIDTANAPIFGVDTMGKVPIWNKNAHKLVGYTSDEVMGQVSIVAHFTVVIFLKKPNIWFEFSIFLRIWSNSSSLQSIEQGYNLSLMKLLQEKRLPTLNSLSWLRQV